MQFCFNGAFFNSEEEAVTSACSGALEFGFSVFETLRTYKTDEIFCTEAHLERLFSSAKMLSLPVEDTRKECISESLEKIVERNKHINHDLRIKIFLCEDFFWIKIEVLEEVPENFYTKGVEVCDKTFERPFPKAKYTSAAYKVFQNQQEKRIFETLFIDTKGFLREGNVSNVFAVFGKEIATPKEKILHGVTREKVIELIHEKNWEFNEREISRKELQKADEIFLTNTTKEIIPVCKWGGEWEGEDFSVSQRLRRGFYEKFLKNYHL